MVYFEDLNLHTSKANLHTCKVRLFVKHKSNCGWCHWHLQLLTQVLVDINCYARVHHLDHWLTAALFN